MTQWVETSGSYLLIQSKEEFSKKIEDEMNWCSSQCSIIMRQSMNALRNLIKGYQTIPYALNNLKRSCYK